MAHDNPRLNDEQAQQAALRYLADVAGPDCVSAVCWDLDHHLQGHVDVCGEHLVVIAARDTEHRPHVFTEADWDALRRGDLSLA